VYCILVIEIQDSAMNCIILQSKVTKTVFIQYLPLL